MSDALPVDEIIRRVKQMANGRTRYEGYVPRWDEVLVAEIERLQARISTPDHIREAAAAAMVRFADPERIQRVMQITNPAQVAGLRRECEELRRDNADLQAKLARAPKQLTISAVSVEL